jgi:hypothetical protein
MKNKYIYKYRFKSKHAFMKQHFLFLFTWFMSRKYRIRLLLFCYKLKKPRISPGRQPTKQN